MLPGREPDALELGRGHLRRVDADAGPVRRGAHDRDRDHAEALVDPPELLRGDVLRGPELQRRVGAEPLPQDGPVVPVRPRQVPQPGLAVAHVKDQRGRVEEAVGLLEHLVRGLPAPGLEPAERLVAEVPRGRLGRVGGGLRHRTRRGREREREEDDGGTRGGHDTSESKGTGTLAWGSRRAARRTPARAASAR